MVPLVDSTGLFPLATDRPHHLPTTEEQEVQTAQHNQRAPYSIRTQWSMLVVVLALSDLP
jgi:hypothetical protein